MSTHNTPILVTGATGKQGGATARQLLADGVAVRALVRDLHTPAAQALAHTGAELALGDFDAPETLAKALVGVRGVFAVPPAAFGPRGWDVERETERGEGLVRLAAAAGVEHFVFSGVASFTDDTPWGVTGKWQVEAAVAASGMRYTLLRPVRFMENYLLQGSPIDGIADGVHRQMFPADQPMQMIAVADIAAFAALAFADPDTFHGQTLELAGDAVAPQAAAEAISKATGTPVRYQEITEAEAAAIGDEIAATWRLVHNGEGWHADIPALRTLHPALMTLDTWLTHTGAPQLKAARNG